MWHRRMTAQLVKAFLLCATITTGVFMLPPLADAACLYLDLSNNFNSFWVNNCPFTVGVNWTDNQGRQGWRCTLYVQ